MGKKNKINKTNKVEKSKNILSKSEEEKELRRIKYELEELKKDYDKKIKKLNQEKNDKTRILTEKYGKFAYKESEVNELEVMNRKSKNKKEKSKDIFVENSKDNKDIKFSIPDYKLPEVGTLYEAKNKFYLAINDYDELEKANEIAKHRYNNAMLVTE